MKKLKIAVIGSGSTYTPELVNGFLTRSDRLGVSGFYMMDIDEAKNTIVSGLAKRMVKAKGHDAKVVVTSCLEEALTGADYVVSQLRVGRLPARVLDERIPLKYGLLGQETTGAGGFFKALRTLPVLENVADIMAKCASPGAWLINFANPSGILAEMLAKKPGINSIGLCNVPLGMEKKLREKSNNAPDFDYDYVGLNHLSWITTVMANGKDIMPQLLADEDLLAYGKLPSTDLLRAVGGIPSYYLNYFYNHDKLVQDAKEKGVTRGEECVKIEEDLLKLYQDESLVEKPELLDKRGGAFYSEAAVTLIDAIENDLNTTHVVNTTHNGVFPFLHPDDVAELKCVVGKNGPTPIPLINPNISQHMIGLIQGVKAYEKLAMKAGLEGNRDAAIAALITNPLIGDVQKAQAVFEDLLEAHKEYLPRF